MRALAETYGSAITQGIKRDILGRKIGHARMRIDPNNFSTQVIVAHGKKLVRFDIDLDEWDALLQDLVELTAKRKETRARLYGEEK